MEEDNLDTSKTSGWNMETTGILSSTAVGDDSVVEIPNHISLVELDTTLKNTEEEESLFLVDDADEVVEMEQTCMDKENDNNELKQNCKDVKDVKKLPIKVKERKLEKVKKVHKVNEENIKKSIRKAQDIKKTIVIKCENCEEKIVNDNLKDISIKQNIEVNTSKKLKNADSKDSENNSSFEDHNITVLEVNNATTLKETLFEESELNDFVSYSLLNKSDAKKTDAKSKMEEKNSTKKQKQEYIELDSATLEDKLEPKKTSKNDRFIWVSNINPNMSANQLKMDLSKYGKVMNAKIVTNGEKYYGHALMEKVEHVKRCVDKLNGRKLKGYEVEISTEAPHKKKPANLKIRDSKNRRSEDPLTLKVDSRNKVKPKTSRSRSRQRREDSIRLQKERDFEMHIEREKRKLASDKEKFEREKLEFLRYQKQLDEAKRLVEEKEAFYKKRANLKLDSPRKRRDISPRKPSPKRRPPKRSYSPPAVRSKVYKPREIKRSVSPKRKLSYIAPPPPPHLTSEDISRPKNDPWKVDMKKPKEYYRNKDDFNLDRNDRKSYDYLKRYHESNYEDKNRRTYNKEITKPSYNQPRSTYGGSSEPRRFDNVSYPLQYNHRNYVPTQPEYQPMQSITQPVWNQRPVYNKDYQPLKPFHQEPHGKYEEFDKRYQHFNARKY